MTTTLEYRGFELVILLLRSVCTVNIASNNPHLMTMLGRNTVVQDLDRERAIEKAKQLIDQLLAGFAVTA
jgi:hypothetical protein